MNNGIKKRITTTSRRRTTRGEERKERKETSGLKEEKHELNKGELNGRNEELREEERSPAEMNSRRLKHRSWKGRRRIMRIKMKQWHRYGGVQTGQAGHGR